MARYYRERTRVLSPDGKRAVFIRDYNLWVRNISDNKEFQLTFDGKEQSERLNANVTPLQKPDWWRTYQSPLPKPKWLNLKQPFGQLTPCF